MQLAHDYCSPSQLDLRYFCPGSVNLQKQMVSSGKIVEKDFALDGTKKHAAMQMWRGKKEPPSDIPDDVIWTLTELLAITEPYADIPESMILDEYQIDLTSLGISGGKEGCRIDLLIVVPGRKAILVDYKFGLGYVPRPRYNWQMKAYAVGVFDAFGISELEVVILQPNAPEEYQKKSDFFYATDIEGFKAQIKQIVDKTKDPEAPLVRGEHCSYGFCKCKDICPLWRNAFLALPTYLTVAAHIINISPAQRKELYENVTAAEQWCKKAKETIAAMALNNEIEIDGWEIGAGKKTRLWNEPDENISAAVVGLARQMGKQINPYQIKSPSEVETELGRSKIVKQAIAPLVIYKEGKPTLKKKENENETD